MANINLNILLYKCFQKIFNKRKKSLKRSSNVLFSKTTELADTPSSLQMFLILIKSGTVRPFSHLDMVLSDT